MDDVRAVMDAVGSERAALMGESEGGPLSILFAAAHPERTRALVLQGAEVRERRDDDWPWGESTPDEFEAAMATIPEHWGHRSDRGLRALAPSITVDNWLLEWDRRGDVNAATPSAAVAFMRMAFDIDVRNVVPAIRVPTLILHRVGDRICHVENSARARRCCCCSSWSGSDGAAEDLDHRSVLGRRVGWARKAWRSGPKTRWFRSRRAACSSASRPCAASECRTRLSSRSISMISSSRFIGGPPTSECLAMPESALGRTAGSRGRGASARREQRLDLGPERSPDRGPGEPFKEVRIVTGDLAERPAGVPPEVEHGAGRRSRWPHGALPPAWLGCPGRRR
jgi:hypothetical protein